MTPHTTGSTDDERQENIGEKCRQPDCTGRGVSWIGCDIETGCGRWYHFYCVDMPRADEPERYHCPSDFIGKINLYYDKCVHWKKNLLDIPHGNAAKDLKRELSSILNHFIHKTCYEFISLKAFHVLLCLALQKPSKTSKAKDHVLYLDKRVRWWREG